MTLGEQGGYRAARAMSGRSSAASDDESAATARHRYKYGRSSKTVTILAQGRGKMPRPRMLFATALLLFSTTAFGQNWRGLLASTSDDLQAQNYARARRTSIKLINSMMDNLNIGQGAALVGLHLGVIG